MRSGRAWASSETLRGTGWSAAWLALPFLPCRPDWRGRSPLRSPFPLSRGQMPLQRRITTRGFNNIFAKAVVAVNLSTLNRKFEDGATVDIEALVNAGVVKNGFDAVKVLGNGKLDKKLTVKVSAFSESAKAAIEAAGGKAEVI